jgi:hypothetical protein
MKKGIAELVADIGNENIEFQLLSQSITKFKTNENHNDHEITFAAGCDKMDSGKQAIIIWCDKGKFNNSLEKMTKDE